MKKKKNNNNGKKNNKKSNILLVVMIIIVVILAGVLIYLSNSTNEEDDKKDVAYTDLINDINNQKIEKIKLKTGSNSITVVYKEGEIEEESLETNTSTAILVLQKLQDNLGMIDEEQKNELGRTKNAIVPSLQAFMEWIQEKIDNKEVDLELIQEPTSKLLSFSESLFSFIPTILLLALMVMIFKMQGFGGDGNGKVYGGEENKSTNVKFEDVAGLDEEKNELIEIVDFLKKPDEYIKMGAKIPRGILLYGKPGTGKTLIAKAIAGEAGVPFISMSGSEFIEMFAGLRSFSC